MAETSANIGQAIVENTVGSSIGGQGFEATTGKPADAWWLQMLEATPGIATSANASAYRGANTIIGGGWGSGRARSTSRVGRGPNSKGSIRQAIRNNNPVRPRTWRRYGSQDIFHGGDGKYTPYQGFSKMVNWGGRTAGLGGEDLLATGGFARMSAGARIENMSAARLAGSWNNTAGFLQGAGYSNADISSLGRGGSQAMGEATALSGGGRLTSGFHGLLQGTKGGYSQEMTDILTRRAQSIPRGTGPIDALLPNSAFGHGDDVTKRGAARAALRFENIGMKYAAHVESKLGIQASEKIGVRTAGRILTGEAGAKGAAWLGTRAAGVALRAAPVIGWALMAHDIAKIATIGTGAAIKGGLKLANDAMRSMQGSMRTSVMDQGFRDNSVSISSRARGVSAIQNSRLNARSVLGSEGAAMHAHFG